MKSVKVYTPYLIAIGCGLLYLFTASQSNLWLDAARFVSAIYTLGIGNPPEPLYVLIAHYFRLLVPFGGPVFKIQVLTAIFSGMILFWLYQTIRWLISKLVAAKEFRSSLRQGQLIAASSFGTLTLAFSYVFWSQSQNVETFILLTLMCLIILNLIVRANPKNFFGHLCLITLLFGLGTGTNPIIISYLPATLLLMWRFKKQLLDNPGRLAILALIAVGSVVGIYSLLPLWASKNPFLNWGRPVDWQGLWEVSTGHGLNVYVPEIDRVNGFTGSPKIFITSVWHFIELFWVKFAVVSLPFMGLGGYYFWSKNRFQFWVLSSVIITNLLFSGLYLSGNQEAWFMLSDLVWVIWAGVGFYYVVVELLPKLLHKYEPRLVPYSNRIGLWMLVLALVPLWFWWPMLDRRWIHITDDYINNVYANMQGPAIFFGSSDLYDSVSFYVHDVLGRRDIVPVTDNIFYILRWYRDNLAATDHLKIPDDSKMKYDSPQEYSQFVNDFFALNLPQYNIYVGMPALRNNFLPRADLGPSLKLDERFKLIPRGMVYQVMPKEASATINLADYNYNFKTEGFPTKLPFFLEKVYRGELTGVLNEYALSYQRIADLALESGDANLAKVFYQRSVEINPKNAELVSRLGNYYGALGDHQKAVEEFQKALKLEPKNVGLLYNLAVAYEHTGQTQQYQATLKKVLKYAVKNSDIARQALARLNGAPEASAPANLVTAPTSDSGLKPGIVNVPADWQTFSDEKMNIAVSYPPSYKATKGADNVVSISNGLPPPDGLSFDIFQTSLKPGKSFDDIEKKLPFKVDGQLAKSQPSKTLGFDSFVKLFDEGNNQGTILMLLRQGDFGAAIKIFPAQTTKISELGGIIQSFRKLK